MPAHFAAYCLRMWLVLLLLLLQLCLPDEPHNNTKKHTVFSQCCNSSAYLVRSVRKWQIAHHRC